MAFTIVAVRPELVEGPFDKLSMNRLKFVIANAVKQSRRLKLDCFAALAMTRFMECVQFCNKTDNSGRTDLVSKTVHGSCAVLLASAGKSRRIKIHTWKPDACVSF